MWSEGSAKGHAIGPLTLTHGTPSAQSADAISHRQTAWLDGKQTDNSNE